MTLEDFKIEQNLSLSKLAKQFGFTKDKVFRIIKDKKCVRLDDAATIEKVTGGKVKITDLIGA